MSETAIEPTWVLTLPNSVPHEVVVRLAKDVTEAIESGKAIVLPEGGMLYDARNSGAPLPMVSVESTRESSIDLPKWVFPAAFIWTGCLVVIAGALVRLTT